MKKIKASLQSVQAFAPATCANVAVGFDCLGFAMESIGDRVLLTKREDKKVLIEGIEARESLPFEPQKNTASVVIEALCQALDLECGFSIRIKKGIPLSSGLGGSAASAVAALVACNAFLISPLSLEKLLPFALLGEKQASGAAHADNVVPCLFGGLSLIRSFKPLKVVQLPIPDLYVTVVHPQLQVPTAEARKILKNEVSLDLHSQQAAHFAAFISALYTKDIHVFEESMQDLIIEPQRAPLVEAFYEMKTAALAAGSLGMPFSGSGPAVFSFARNKHEAEAIACAIKIPLAQKGIEASSWISKINPEGAKVMEDALCVI